MLTEKHVVLTLETSIVAINFAIHGQYYCGH